MTTLYNVHLYREMRLMFPGIEADTPEAAASIARSKRTDEADTIDDCDGNDLGALVDEVGDEEYEHSRFIDFEANRREAAPELLEALDYVRATLKLRHIDEASDDEVAEALAMADKAIADAVAIPEPSGGPIVTVTVHGGLVQDVEATAPVTVIVEDWDASDEDTGQRPARSVHALPATPPRPKRTIPVT